ncbi:hypothetical protein B0H13DRAFT_2663988 [Mycena leptocephala]|nr:hypothetical protein B0H13DRAFT_2663988 [Mycena leptocephala]
MAEFSVCSTTTRTLAIPFPATRTSRFDGFALSEELVRFENEIPRLHAQLEKGKPICLSQGAYERVCSLLAPIRRLPSEVLVQIFEECEVQTAQDQNAVVNRHSLEGQLARLARKPLLMVSQVCVRWHEIVLGTPTFWNTIELHSVDLWRTEQCVPNALALLKLALERSGNTPLIFGISIMRGMDCTKVLKLLAQHCERWKTVSFYCRWSDLQNLRSVKGRLPLLETLEVEVYDSSVDMVHPFEIAPRLKNFVVGGAFPPTVTAVHLDKLHTFGCLGQDPMRVPTALSFMSRMPHGIEFRLELFLSNWTDDNITGIDVPPTVSNILSFSMNIRDYFEPEHCLRALSDILGCLTLPHIRDLKFRSEESPFSLLYWSHSAFMGLATRSSFQTHLHTLALCDVVVTQAELVEALGVLPLLQHLEISDHEIIRGHGANQLLITDYLLSALTLKAPHTQRLAPLLQSHLCQSLLQFDDQVYLDFLLSRRRQAPSDSAPFVSRMYWQPAHRRAFDAGVVARIRELCIRKELVCDFSHAAC